MPHRPSPSAVRVWPWLLLSVLGTVLPWFFNLRYFAQGGSVLPQVFWRDAGANALTTAITLDVYLAAISFCVWVVAERRVRHRWAWVLACGGIGLATVLPLYLWRRRAGAQAGPGAAQRSDSRSGQ